MRVLRDKVRAATAISKATRLVSAVVADLNPVLRGWGAYFRNGNSEKKFNAVDGYVHERLAILASRKHGLRVGTGPPVSPTDGSPDSGSAALPEPYAGRRRTPVGERCRKAVCGRTACTV
ncbi:group II intron maturase-specific domain-containing protein [Streptomyces sioyaensis]|uniref:group II intron maturase-specific domain-containing protein n=1 Tax=Streptomyces sioyaensis TaxID=67364 RepID=UPI0033C80FA9